MRRCKTLEYFLLVLLSYVECSLFYLKEPSRPQYYGTVLKRVRFYLRSELFFLIAGEPCVVVSFERVQFLVCRLPTVQSELIVADLSCYRTL